MNPYDCGDVTEALGDLLQDVYEDQGLALDMGDVLEDEDAPFLTVDKAYGFKEQPEKGWFELVGTDGRRFRVTVTEIG